jgi:hypothetical protein
MRLLQPIDALRGALIDPARRERSVLLALAAYLALWTIYGTIAKSSQGLHPDMTELLAWSRDLAWGYKHPPLAALIVRLWFSLFPVAEWSYYLLAMLMPTSRCGSCGGCRRIISISRSAWSDWRCSCSFHFSISTP